MSKIKNAATRNNYSQQQPGVKTITAKDGDLSALDQAKRFVRETTESHSIISMEWSGMGAYMHRRIVRARGFV